MPKDKRALFVSYNAATEPLVKSQALPYISALSAQGIKFYLMSFEKEPAAGADVSKELKDAGIGWIRLKFHHKPFIIAKPFDIKLGSLVALWTCITKKIDIVHARGIMSACISLVPAKLCGARFIFDMKSSLAEGYRLSGRIKRGSLTYKALAYLERLCVLNSDEVIVETNVHKGQLENMASSRKRPPRITVLPCCVDIERFAGNLQGAYPPSGGGIKLVYLGSLSGWYMLPEMLSFFEAVKKARPGSEFLFLTDDKDGSLGRMIKERKLEGVMIVKARYEDVPRYLRGATAGILFKRPNQRLDSFPIKIAEYLAAGLPVVINSGMGDVEELVSKNRAGVVVGSCDTGSYIAALGVLEDLVKEGGSMRERCGKVAAEHLPMSLGSSVYSAIYDRLMKKRVIFIVPYPKEGASVRLRVEQFLPVLDKAGIRYAVRPFLTSRFYGILYEKGHAIGKFLLFIFCSCRRLVDLARALFYDIVFIHREMFPIGPPLFEAALFLFGKKVIFDFDDAIYLPPEGSAKIMSMMKCPWKTDFIIKHSSLVIAGNEFLRDHARLLNKNVSIIPTCIDTDKYNGPGPAKGGKDDVVIGWIGSHTTRVYLKNLERAFLSLLDKYKDLKICLVGSRSDGISHERIIIREWSLDTERDDIRSFDIGIMPMPDTDWTKGKCGFKAILYMTCGLPVVASPVGTNLDIIDDGINGFLAGSVEEWIRKLSMLVEDPALRDAMGRKGREKALKEYSLASNAPLFYKNLESVWKK
ncbi:MAG: glycosyltransferase [Candidatus Omnitrophica bacterium]|nr:glycosyltransferase [Candidatus Omnitrophota bacterium]